VSIFFVLSGFLLFYTYYKKDMIVSVSHSFRFAISKIKKLYSLHLLTMFCTVLVYFIISFYGVHSINIGVLIRDILLNVALLQTWIPDSSINASLNGVAWYLSATLFLYFSFPFIKKRIQNIKNSVLIIVSVIILILQVMGCIPMLSIFGKNSSVYVWFMYSFPVFRLGDFFIGCCLGKYFLEHENHGYDGKYRWTIAEISLMALTVWVIIWTSTNVDSLLLDALQNWTTLYVPLASGWVYLFAMNKGIITKFFHNRVFVFLGNMSPYMFLIHFVITQTTYVILLIFNLSLYGIWKIISVTIQLFLTIVITLAYMRFKKYDMRF